MTIWQHPTGIAPKTVTLVCLGPSRNTYIGGLFEHDLAESCIGADEIWTLNRGSNVFRHDLLWVMDHIQGEADKHPRYGASLWHHDKPIITSDNLDGWPAHVHAYPFKAVWNWLIDTVNPMHGDWFHNSVAYIVVYAAFIGVKELRVFGADYASHSSGVVEDGHPCVAYWVGKMEAAGMVVKAPVESHFLGINQRGWIYGYRHDPRNLPSRRKRFRDLIGLPPEADSVDLLSGERQVAPTLAGIQIDHVNRYRWAAQKVQGTVYDLGCGIGYGSAVLADSEGVNKVFAVDRSAESIAYAQQHYARDLIEYAVADLSRPGMFTLAGDWAVAFELVEHLVDPLPLLRDLPVNHLIISVPNESAVPYSPETAPHHHRHYTRVDLAGLLSDAGWRPVCWRCQMDREGPVIEYREDCRTILIEAQRCLDSSTTTTAIGA